MQSNRVSNPSLGLGNMGLGHLENLYFLEAKGGGGGGHGKEEDQSGGTSAHFFFLAIERYCLFDEYVLAWICVVGKLIYSQVRKHKHGLVAMWH